MKARLPPLSALAMVAALLALAGCRSTAATTAPPAPPTPSAAPPTKVRPPTATAPEPYDVVTDLQLILGKWKLTDSIFVRFDQDGTFRGAHRLDELDSGPYHIHTCELKDGRLEIAQVRVVGVPSCGSKVGRYEVRLLESRNLQLVLIQDPCAPRAADTAGVYSRLP